MSSRISEQLEKQKGEARKQKMKCRRETEQQMKEEEEGESVSILNREQNCVLCYPQGASKAFLSLPKRASSASSRAQCQSSGSLRMHSGVGT